MVKNIQNKIRKRRAKKTHIFDIEKIKKVIKKELYSQYSSIENDDNLRHKNTKTPPIKTSEEEDKIYSMKFSKYLAEEFNSRIVNMIILYINKNKSFPLEFKKESNFIYNFINLLKHLLMNEFEISYFTILLDRIGWKWQNVEHWTYFCILGIYTKNLCGKEDESSLLLNIISRNSPEFTDYYTNWVCDEEIDEKIKENEINLKSINERFKQLIKPINTFCRKNYINYNGMADKIVKLSQPYGDQNNGNQIKSNEQFNSNNGIIDSNQIKAISALNNSFNLENNYNYLKNNLIMQPMNSNVFSQNRKGMVYYPICQSRCSIDEEIINNQSNFNLSLINKRSSQFSLKSDNLF